jgi:hypothetical protein
MISKTKEAEIMKIGQEIRQMDEQIRIKNAIQKTEKRVKEETERRVKEETEKEKTIEFALKLKNKGFNLEDISDITGLSIEKLEKIND